MKRPIAAVLGAAAILALAAAPVSASHTHVMALGNGQCVLLAYEAGEESVVLPLSVFENNPNVTIAPTAGRMHPLHVLVHLGEAGTHHQIAVAGSAAAAALCTAGIVND
ncbi:MAG: hypothetical protein A2V85_17280 [Chloroflexi bacterium RBG_16_72_14]|nr:MAG: hypothetical protein A2V85_17280 [Chloroflexi bacterium RBG_16_72_14]